MFNFSDLEIVNIEISNRCQAACPMCPRNIHGGIENPLLKVNDWTIDDFKTIFPPAVVRHLKEFRFCGNFGDPLMNNDLLKMCEYITHEDSSSIVYIHTNGSLRDTKWWKQLVEVLPKNHFVVFALDGLSDTHALYRINTSFETIIKNASTFISAGGNAIWHYIRFQHNAHQVDEAREMAIKLGFKNFTIKDSRRFTSPQFKVVDSQGNQTHTLSPMSNIPIVNKKEILSSYDTWSNSNRIYCYALDEHDLFIDAHFTVLPCCILASFLYTSYDENLLRSYNLYDDATSVNTLGGKIKDQVLDIIEELGGFSALDARNGIENILNTSKWQTIWHEKWKTYKSLTCMLMCSKDSPFLSLKDQVASVEQVNDV